MIRPSSNHGLSTQRVGLRLKGERGVMPGRCDDASGKILVPDERPGLRVKVLRGTEGEPILKAQPHVEFSVEVQADGRTRIQPMNCVFDPDAMDRAPGQIRRALIDKGVTDESTITAFKDAFLKSLETG
jgi:hypothetical protein